MRLFCEVITEFSNISHINFSLKNCEHWQSFISVSLNDTLCLRFTDPAHFPSRTRNNFPPKCGLLNVAISRICSLTCLSRALI
jgi:hypothetical protein